MTTADDLFDISGQVAVITGGGGVLCSTMAKALAARGVKVAVLDIIEAAAQKVAEIAHNDVAEPSEEMAPLERVETPNQRTIDQITEFLGVPATKLVKSLIYRAGERIVAALVRGDRELSEDKLKALLGVPKVQMADPATIAGWYEAAGAAGLDCESGILAPLPGLPGIYEKNKISLYPRHCLRPTPSPSINIKARQPLYQPYAVLWVRRAGYTYP